MRQYAFIVSALLCACTAETPLSTACPPLFEEMSLRACCEDATKTSLSSDYGVLWSTSDKITLFTSAGVAGTQLGVSSVESGGSIATFTGLVPATSGECLYALYPASSDARLTGASGSISTQIPTVQTGVENSFAQGANVSIARINPGDVDAGGLLHFKNAGALLSFTVPGNYITRVRIESIDESVPMSGPATISYNDGSPSVSAAPGARNYVDVTVPERTLGKRYYAVAYPGNYSRGFRVSFYTSVNYYNRYTSSKPLVLERCGNVRLIEKNWVQNDDRDKSETGYETSSDPVSVSISSAQANYYNFVVYYTISGLASVDTEHGLVFSYSNPEPTCGAVGKEGKLPGPVPASTGTATLLQCVPNAPLRPGQTCYLRAYCYDGSAGGYVYSPVQQLTLPAQPEGLGISKSALDSPATGVSLFSFTAGDSYKGFCAVADCSSSSPVRLGVNNARMGTTSAISMASQLSSSGALVLVNGQIFGSQGNLGLAYTGGELRYNNSSDDGISACRGYGNDYSSWQPITRAILGVDADGRPGAYWCSLIGGKPYFFDRPIPAGSAVYPQVTASSGPGPARSWSPSEALSTGPMLLYDGKVCVSEDRIDTGVYYTNYELWSTRSGDIYGSSRPRTAIGFNSESGKMYLAVVSSGVTLTRMALIMKGLGCDYAMNLDGGGSVQMSVRDRGNLTSNTRAVKSTVGFFRKTE